MGDLEQHISALPFWTGTLRLEPLLGGLSNLNFLATDATGAYVVRSGQDFAFHQVSRTREVMSARAAHAGGFSPEIVYAEPGLMVSRFIEGKVFTAADMRVNIERVARFMRHFHDEMPRLITGPAYLFWVFHVVRDYANALKGSSNPLTRRLPQLLAINEELEAAQIPLPIKFGHHDLLPANLIDDGARLWLIDFEYAGFGTAMFDLAGLSSNAGFDAAQSGALLAAYFDSPVSSLLLRSHAAMQCASLLREGLWALVSELHLSAPGADYNTYALDNFSRFDAALASYFATYPRN